MIGGDFDDVPLPPEIYVVWEDLIALPTGKYRPERFARRLRWRGPAAALGLFETNTPVLRALWELWEADQRFAVVSYLPREATCALKRRLEHDNVPYTDLVISQRSDMSRLISLVREVLYIVHGNPGDQLLYGPKGIYVPADRPDLIRRSLL